MLLSWTKAVLFISFRPFLVPLFFRKIVRIALTGTGKLKLISLKLIVLRTTWSKVKSLLGMSQLPQLPFTTAARLWTRMAGRPGAKPYIFAPVRSLVQFVSSVVSLRGSMLFRSALWDVCLFVCF